MNNRKPTVESLECNFYVNEVHKLAGSFAFIVVSKHLKFGEISDAQILYNGEPFNGSWVELQVEAGKLVLSGSALIDDTFEIKAVTLFVVCVDGRRYKTSFPSPSFVDQGPISFRQRDGVSSIGYWSRQGLTEVKSTLSEKLSETRERLDVSQCYYHRDSFSNFTSEFVEFLPQNTTFGQNISDISSAIKSTYLNKKVQALRNIHEGKDAVLIGNGPSLQLSSLNKFQNHIFFSFNRFYLSYEQTEFRPDYLISADSQMIMDFGQEMIDKAESNVILASHSMPSLQGEFAWLNLINIFPALFSEDIDKFVCPGGATPYVAMQLASYMGIKNLYLLGFDYQYSMQRGSLNTGDKFVNGDNNHFVANYRNGRPWIPPSLRNICHSFWMARLHFEQNGGRIINLTPNSALSVFEKQIIF